jgi:hypothetical protein
MAPRKSTKSPETEEEKGPSKKVAKPAARPRKTKAEAEARPVKPEPVPAPEPQPEKPAKRTRKPKAAEAEVPSPAPEAEAAPVPAEPRPLVLPVPALPAQAQTLLAAITEGRAVELLFADSENNPPRTFEPRQLIFDAFTKAWFVWGWDRRYNAERHHRVDLLAEVNPVEGVGRAAQGPYKDGTPANQIGGWLGGEPIHVKAVLLKQWIYAVKQAPAVFPDFKLEDLEEGKAQVTFVGTDLRAIARWCMQFGDGIQVIEPQRLVDRIKQVGVSWAGKAAQAPAPKPQPVQEPRPEPKPEPRKTEHSRHEHREAREHREPREHREARESRESETPRSRSGKIEIHIDRL